MAKSIKINFIFNLISTLSGVLFPLITFPYASRIMEADGIGQVGFFSSIISYISLFTSLGIPIYAIREIARVRDDESQMNKTAVEILLLHTALTFIGYIMVALMCLFVAKVSIDIPLFLILSTSLFFTAIGCEWFYRGIEDFKYITIRGLVVKVLYVILLFSFVHSKSDLYIYAALTVLGTVGNNIFNFFRLRKYIKPSLLKLKELSIIRHLAPSLKIFTLNLVISLYLNMNTVMLGFFKDSATVGYYEVATKLTGLILGVVQALQNVMIPRFSYLAKEETKKEFDELCQRVMDFVVTISIPMSLGLLVLSAPLIHLFCGLSYEPAIKTLSIMSPIIFLVGLSGISGFQILYPLGKENLVILGTAAGALVNLLVCFVLIPSFAQNGAAIATLIGEAAVTVTLFALGRQYIHVKYMSTHYMNCIVGGLLMFVTIYVLSRTIPSDWMKIVIIPISGAIVYGAYLFFRKDSFSLYLLEMVKNKVDSYKNR